MTIKINQRKKNKFEVCIFCKDMHGIALYKKPFKDGQRFGINLLRYKI